MGGFGTRRSSGGASRARRKMSRRTSDIVRATSCARRKRSRRTVDNCGAASHVDTSCESFVAQGVRFACVITPRVAFASILPHDTQPVLRANQQSQRVLRYRKSAVAGSRRSLLLRRVTAAGGASSAHMPRCEPDCTCPMPLCGATQARMPLCGATQARSC